MQIGFVLESLAKSETQQLNISSTGVLNWFNTGASADYQDFINQQACNINQSIATYRFCVQDTLLSQSPLLGQLTVRSSLDYQTADRSLGKKSIRSI